MGWKPKKSPSFVKFLLCPDFADNLPIPPLFVSKYLHGQKTMESPILVVYNSAKSYSWPVTIMDIGGGGRYCFKLGWWEFCQDNHLERGDFLLFWLIGDSTFLVAIYGPSGIEKRIITKPTFTDSVFEVEQVSSDLDTTCKFKNRKVKEQGDDIAIGMPQAATSMKQLDNPSFKVIIKKSSFYRPYIPKLFVEETRISASMRSMVLINAAGREWPVKITHPNSRSLGYVMTSGWSTFRKANNIEIGDTMQFLRNEGNIIHVKVLKRKGSTRISRGRNEGQYKTGKKEDGLFEAAASVKPLNTLSFKARLGRSSNYSMGLPIWFVRETRLARRRNTMLKDESGCEYPVRIQQRKNSHGYDMGTGWANFRRAINIDKGDICLFQLFRNEGNIIHVKVVDRKRRGAGRVQRRRGRPSLNKDHPRP